MARLREFHDRAVAAQAGAKDAGCDASPSFWQDMLAKQTQTQESWPDDELRYLREKIMRLEELLRQAADADLLRKRLRESRQANEVLKNKLEDMTDERDAAETKLARAENTIGKRDRRIRELEAQLIALEEEWKAKLSNAMDSVKLCVIAPRLKISFEGGTTVVGVPTIPRDQLLRLLNDDLLPRFSRIFSDRTTECEGEKELLEYSSPESQSVWLKEHLDALRDTVTQQIEALFGEPAGDEVLGQRRAAAALAKGGS